MTIKKLKEIIEQYEYEDDADVTVEINEKFYDPVVYDDEYSRKCGIPTLVFYYGKEMKESKSRSDKEGAYCWELCPHCEHEVKLETKFKKQTCPSCGKSIIPCCMCEDINCNNCPLDDKKLNDLQANQLKIINHYGIDVQLQKLAEECAELIQAILKSSFHAFGAETINEMADVLNLIEQLKLKDEFINKSIEIVKEYKIERQINRIQNEGSKTRTRGNESYD